ncbi:MAG: glycosyltransferase [Gemmataceae bacterium]|nr:glycosyltransferase [Gemmataceae bacterium]
MRSAAMEGKRELVALVDSASHVCCRYRILPFEKVFHEMGFRLRLEEWPSSLGGRISLILSLRGKTVLLQRKLISSWLVWLMKKQGAQLIFDFDDAVFLRDSYSEKGFADPGRLRRFTRICQSARAVIAGNSFLAQHARKWNSGQVYVVPTSVDPLVYPVESRPQKNPDLTLVWVGSSSTLQSLEHARAGLDAVGDNFPGVHMKVICDRFPEFAKLQVKPVAWEEATEVKEISSSDVGFSWMPDDPWSQGKCGLKVLQYMAAGLPVIANPVGVHKEMVEDGKTGFLVESTGEFLQAISALRGNPNLRQQMGKKGREKLERDYSVAKAGNLWRVILSDFQARLPVAG